MVRCLRPETQTVLIVTFTWVIDVQAHLQTSLLPHLSTQNDNETVQTKRLKCSFEFAVKMYCFWVGINIGTSSRLQMTPCSGLGMTDH